MKNNNITHYYFTRHGYSFSNNITKNISINKAPKLLTFYLKDMLKDPNLHNYGIKNSIRNNHSWLSKECQDIYVSPLIRTWQTASLMFPNAKKAKIGPYLRESSNKFNPSDLAFSYKKNTKRFKLFNKFTQKKYNFIPRLEIVKNNTDSVYGPGNLQKFIKWHSKNKKSKNKFSKKVLVVCHGNLIKNLLKDNKSTLYKRKLKNVNNYIVDVKFNNLTKKIESISLIFKGVKQPLDMLGISNSLCV